MKIGNAQEYWQKVFHTKFWKYISTGSGNEASNYMEISQQMIAVQQQFYLQLHSGSNSLSGQPDSEWRVVSHGKV